MFAKSMAPMSLAERRRYLEAVKEKKAAERHLASDPSRVTLRRPKRKVDNIKEATSEVQSDMEVIQGKK